METALETQNDNYRVDLPVFSGPMDLLLFLIRKEEVDIYDIPISRITSQYLKYLEMMRTLDLEVAGEFILMAATLIRIKTRLLLPRDESELQEEDPREELIMALVEYKKYKEAGEVLREKELYEEQNFVPESPIGKIEGKTEFTPSTTFYDLLMAFRTVMAERREESVHEVVPEEISIDDRIRVIVTTLGSKEWASFTELFADTPKKIFAIVTFIAILELARTHRIRILQSMPFAELRVTRGDMFTVSQTALEIHEAAAVAEEVEV
jgi:segregation and condensation protein A